jgi:dTDP-4-dehydrorhamnose reductase
MLGRRMGDVFAARGATVEGFDLPETDIRDAAAVTALLDRARPDVLVNCAALTDVDGCETRRDEAFAANAEGPEVLARCCRDRGVRLVHISTDFVFDGRKGSPYREDDPTGPVCVYGESKLAGEARVAAAGGEWLVVRTAWLYGPGGRNFVRTILEKARELDRLRVVSDQRGCPTYTADLAEAVADLADAGATGVVHVVNEGSCSWYDLAKAALTCAGIATPVEAITAAALGRPARRPACSVLDTSRLASLIGRRPRCWEEALEVYVASCAEDA